VFLQYSTCVERVETILYTAPQFTRSWTTTRVGAENEVQGAWWILAVVIGSVSQQFDPFHSAGLRNSRLASVPFYEKMVATGTERVPQVLAKSKISSPQSHTIDVIQSEILEYCAPPNANNDYYHGVIVNGCFAWKLL
jgi:hypothetical protein